MHLPDKSTPPTGPSTTQPNTPSYAIHASATKSSPPPISTYDAPPPPSEIVLDSSWTLPTDRSTYISQDSSTHPAIPITSPPNTSPPELSNLTNTTSTFLPPPPPTPHLPLPPYETPQPHLSLLPVAVDVDVDKLHLPPLAIPVTIRATPCIASPTQAPSPFSQRQATNTTS
jgi:hypothetical protein